MVVSPLEGHRIWAPEYDRGLNPLLALEERVVPRFPASRIIDVACGTGRWTARLGAIGIDLCEEMLRQRSHNAALRGRFALADAAALPFASGVSDLTLCSFAIAYIQNLAAAVSEMARVTRPGGRVVISDLHPAAIAAGWTRSFRSAGVLYELEHPPGAVEETLLAARRCGLELSLRREACFGEPERPIFEAAGKPLEQVAGTPAVWLAVWTKP